MDAGAVDGRMTRPLRANLPKYSSPKKMTHEKLLQERQAFWTSRTSGNVGIWNTLEQVAAMILDSNDVDTASAILQASGISTPHGDISEVFDERGVRYEVPRYCFQNPTNLVDGMGEQAPRRGNFRSEEIEIKFRMAYGSETSDTKCTVNTTDSIGDIVEAFKKANEKAAAASRIRLFFYGRELRKNDQCAACYLRKTGLVVLAVLYE